MLTLAPVKSILAKPGTVVLWPEKEKKTKTTIHAVSAMAICLSCFVKNRKWALFCSHACSTISVIISISPKAPPFLSVSTLQCSSANVLALLQRAECFSVHSSGCERQHTYCLAVYYNGKNAGPCSSNTMVIYLFECRIQYWGDTLKKQHSVLIF